MWAALGAFSPTSTSRTESTLHLMQLFIRTTLEGGKCVMTLNVEATDRIDSIKARALALIGVSAALEAVSLDGCWLARRAPDGSRRSEVLENGRTLSDYNIQDGETLSMAW